MNEVYLFKLILYNNKYYLFALPKKAIIKFFKAQSFDGTAQKKPFDFLSFALLSCPFAPKEKIYSIHMSNHSKIFIR